MDQIINAMADAPTSQMLLILDDAHLLTESGEIPLILDRLIGLAPASFHVLLAGRPTISLPTLTRWRAQGEALILDQSILTFTKNETASLFDVHYGLELTSEELDSLLGVPTLFQLWMNSPLFAETDFSHVHFFISGGAPCPPSLIDAWSKAKGVTMRQGYGLTEVGVNCFSMTDEDAPRKRGSVGKPIFHSEMRLVDTDGKDVKVGEIGELLIKGPHVCVGYWKNAEATTQSLKEGWFHTGDMARMDEEGYFYIVGRFKDMIISGGENIYAAEVEAVFREHASVADAALIGQPDEKWGEVGLMIVACNPNQTVNAEELLKFCSGRLAKYKIPKRVKFVNALPYSPYGKVMKAELKKAFLNG